MRDDVVSLKSRILKNTKWLMASSLFSSILKFGLITLTARLLGPEQFGQLSYTMVVLGTGIALGDLGLSTLYQRDYHRTENKQDHFNTFASLQISTLIVTIPIAIIMYTTITAPDIRSIYIILFVRSIITYLNALLFNHARTVEQMKQQGISTIIDTAVTVTIGLVSLLIYPSIQLLAIAYTIGSIAGLMYTTFAFSDLIKRFHFCLSLHHAAKLIKTSSIFMLTNTLNRILAISDVIVIERLLGFSSVGYYQAVRKLVMIIISFITYFIRSVSPVLMKFHNHTVKLKHILRKAFTYILVIMVPICIGVMIFQDYVIYIVYGKQYSDSTVLLSYFLPLLFITPYLKLINITLTTLNEHIKNLRISIAAIVSNIILNVVLVYIFGLKGIVIATITAKSIDIIISYRLLRYHLGPTYPYVPTTIITLIAAGIMSIIITLFSAWVHLPPIVVIIIAALSYTVLIAISPDIHHKELRDEVLKSFLKA